LAKFAAEKWGPAHLFLLAFLVIIALLSPHLGMAFYFMRLFSVIMALLSPHETVFSDNGVVESTSRNGVYFMRLFSVTIALLSPHLGMVFIS